MNKNKITRILSLLFIVLFYFVGVITDGLLILGAALPPSPSVWIPVLAGHVLTSFMIFIIPIITILLFLNQYKKVGNHGISKKGILSILAVGLIILTPMLIHISRASSTAYRVESRFTEGWGEEWRKDITAPQELYPTSTAPWQDQPFNLWNWIFGPPIDHSRYDLTTDVIYRRNENYSLRCDVYKPQSDGNMYGEGPYPTIMVLHPGSWKYMDKGYGSMSTASQYLAAQGNVVFDLQYGAQEEEGVGKENQETMLGIVRNIAGFTTWLANTTSTPWEDAPLGEGGQQITGRYNADLRNIVSLGRSAGAHLASLTSLSYQNSTWESYDVHWAPEVRYTGSITYYSPMNPTLFTDALDPSKYGDTELYRDMNSTDDMYMISPYHHLKTASPPVLQLIGTEDNYGLYNVNVAFKERAEQLGTKCVLLTFKGSDHSYDAIPTHPPTQISLWAVERFLQLCREEGQ